MIHWLKASFSIHPWLTGLEGVVGVVVLIELILLATLGFAWARYGVTSWMDARRGSKPYRGYAPETFKDDAHFFVTFGMVAVVLAGIALALAGGIGWGWVAFRGGSTGPFLHAALGGVGLTVASVAWILFSGRVFGGGILPH